MMKLPAAITSITIKPRVVKDVGMVWEVRAQLVATENSKQGARATASELITFSGPAVLVHLEELQLQLAGIGRVDRATGEVVERPKVPVRSMVSRRRR